MIYNIGDTVYASFGRYGRTDVRKGTVINVSPAGTVKVDFGTSLPRSFKPNGLERGKMMHDAAALIEAATYERLLPKMHRERTILKANEAIKLITGVSLDGSNIDAVITRLERALELARKVKV